MTQSGGPESLDPGCVHPGSLEPGSPDPESDDLGSVDPGTTHHRAHGGSRSHNRALPTDSSEPPRPVSAREVRPAQRVWLQEDGVRMFGPGTHELLRRVEQTGSLNRAAKDMAMSYSKAWRMVHEVEERLGLALFESRTGGPEGGGSRLTNEGRLLLLRFDAFTREADDALEALYEKHFGDLPYAAVDGLSARGSDDPDDAGDPDGAESG